MSYELEGDESDEGYGLKTQYYINLCLPIKLGLFILKLLSSIKTPRHSDARNATPL